MTRFLLFLLTVISISSTAQAQEPFVCITSDLLQQAEVTGEEARFELARLRCADLSRVATGLEVVSLTAQAGSMYMACTGVGVNVSVLLQGGALGLRFIKVLVGNLPCETNDSRRLEADVNRLVCEELTRQGVSCRRR